MDPIAEPLTMYGALSAADDLDWEWARDQLAAAGTYWVVARPRATPHPRPVWGVWLEDRVYLSLGSPLLRAELADDPRVAVHLDSGTDVVVLEGRVTGERADDAVVREYDHKYDWDYDADEYGPFTEITPETVVAWRAGGWAGRDGFNATARFRFPTT
jgi:hypothetical protein